MLSPEMLLWNIQEVARGAGKNWSPTGMDAGAARKSPLKIHK